MLLMVVGQLGDFALASTVSLRFNSPLATEVTTLAITAHLAWSNYRPCGYESVRSFHFPTRLPPWLVRLIYLRCLLRAPRGYFRREGVKLVHHGIDVFLSPNFAF